MGLTEDEKVEALSIDNLLRQGYDMQFKKMTICDLKKHYNYQGTGRRYQVHNDTSDIKINEVLADSYTAAECFVLAKRNIR